MPFKDSFHFVLEFACSPFFWSYQNVTNFSVSVNGIVITEISSFVTFQ